MEYTIDELNIPDIYTDDINEFKNYESNIHEIEITLRPYETYETFHGIHLCNYLITNNTKLYIVYGSKFYGEVCGDENTRNIYNKMYLCKIDRIKIRNYSDEIAHLKIFMVKHIPEFIYFSTYNDNQGEMKLRYSRTGKIYGIITDNIVIRTNEKINLTYKYFDTQNMMFCYKIKNVRDDIYELKLCKITNKINNKSIIIPQKNINNIYQYYSIIYYKLNDICSECPTDTIYQISLCLINSCEIFNYQRIFYDDFYLRCHYEDSNF
jgi:hypothetical protein